VNELVLIRKIEMKAEGGGQGEEGKSRRYHAGAEAQNQQHASHHFHPIATRSASCGSGRPADVM
jgi:hypothetical protein